MEHRKIIEKDYIDIETGMRFVEDIRGVLHCCSVMPMTDTTPQPTPPIDISIPPVEVNIPPLEVENPYKDKPLIILQSSIEGFTWPNTSSFHRIINSYGSGYVAFTTPIDKELHIESIVVTQSKNEESNASKQSIIGLYKGIDLKIALPVVRELNFKFTQPYKIEHSTLVEFKFKPFNKKLELNILVMGYLMEI